MSDSLCDQMEQCNNRRETLITAIDADDLTAIEQGV